MVLFKNQMGRIIENLSDLHWDIILVYDLKLWEVVEVLLMVFQTERFIQRYMIEGASGKVLVDEVPLMLYEDAV